MNKVTRTLLLILALCAVWLGLDSCAGSNHGASAPAFGERPQPGEDAKLLLSQENGADAWYIYAVPRPDGQSVVRTFHHGDSWVSSDLPSKDTSDSHIAIDNLFASLADRPSRHASFILMTSDPAAGLMNKRLFRSDDRGARWTAVADLSTIVDGYVTGISFANDRDGWVGATYHGDDLVPLYRTTDGGRTWTLQPIPLPEGFRYGDVAAPVFDPDHPAEGTMTITFARDDERRPYAYRTEDGGAHWEAVSSPLE